jgi:predicted lipid-binding transport protein (Tim44 family)
MSQIVYGTFKTEAEADAALGRLRALADRDHPDETHYALMYTGHFRGEEVQLGGTLGLAGGVIGGLVVGILGGLVAQFMIWPTAGVDFGWAGMVLMMIAGSIFGVVAGAVAGASECKGSLRRDAERAQRHGEVMLICEAERRSEVPKIVEALGEDVAHAA